MAYSQTHQLQIPLSNLQLYRQSLSFAPSAQNLVLIPHLDGSMIGRCTKLSSTAQIMNGLVLCAAPSLTDLKPLRSTLRTLIQQLLGLRLLTSELNFNLSGYSAVASPGAKNC